MAYYIHRERYSFDTIAPNAKVTFPTSVSESFNRAAFRYVLPYSEMDEQDWVKAKLPSADILYHAASLPLSIEGVTADDEGNFDLYLPGTYMIFWFVSQMSGLDASGRFFCPKRWDGAQQTWIPLSENGQSLKVSASGGCTPLIVTLDDLLLEGKVTVALFNESSTPLKMNRTPHVKAALAIFGFGEIGGDVETLREEIGLLMDSCDADRRERIKAIRVRIAELQKINQDQNDTIDELCVKWDELYSRFVIHSLPKASVASRDFSGLVVNFIRTGYEYQFYASGSLTSPVSFPALAGGKYYLVTVQDLPVLSLYNYEYDQGLTTIKRPPATTLCYKGTGPILPYTYNGSIGYSAVTMNNNIWPLYIDETGIYFDQGLGLTGSSVLPVGSVIRFNEVISFQAINYDYDNEL